MRSGAVSAQLPRERPPGPPGEWLAGNLGAFERDRLGFLSRARTEFGDLVSFDARTTIVNGPDLAARVLEDRERQFGVLNTFLGETVGGDQYARRRLTHRHLSGSLREPLLSSARDLTLDGVWDRFPATSARLRIEDVTARLESVTAEVVAEVFFGAGAHRVLGPVAELFEALEGVFLNPFALPSVFPTPRRRRVRAAHHAARETVESAMAVSVTARGRPGVAHVLAQGAHSSEQTAQLADQVLGAMLASRRVPAAGAAWALKAVVEDVRLQGRLVESLRADPPTPLHPACPGRRSELDMLVVETLRLYPPTWLIRRTALTQVDLGGFRFPAGHHFVLSPYVIHRDARSFTEPDAFRSQRWQDTRGHGTGYLAFGRGPHRCPGTSLASVIVGAAVQALATRFDLSQTGQVLTTAWRPDASGTLVPRDAVLALSPRADH